MSERFKVNLTCLSNAETIRTNFYYDSRLITESDINRIAEQFQTIVRSVIVNPDAAIDALDVVGEKERQYLLQELNDTTRDFGKPNRLHELFEEQVERTPNAVAVVFDDQKLTYRELDAKANQLAHYLRNAGAGPETLVGVFMERSLEMIVSLLGVLKAGAAYVPLDPAYPAQRLVVHSG